MISTKKLLYKAIEAFGVDYVIEEGTSGSWRYRKWKSGRLEQWRRADTGTYTINQANGALYVGNWYPLTYPIEFYDYPSVTANASLDTTAYVILTQLDAGHKDKVYVRCVATSSVSGISLFSLHIHAVGRWKA